MRLTTKKHGEVLSIPEPSGKCNTELASTTSTACLVTCASALAGQTAPNP